MPTIDSILNFILFLTRVGTFLVSAVLSFNLLSDLRNNLKKEKNGVKATRLTLISLVLSLLLENFIYSLAYLHATFDTMALNQWLTQAKPVLILARAGVFYGVIQLFLLFFHKPKE